MIGRVALAGRWGWLHLVLLAVSFSPLVAGESQQAKEPWKPATRQWIETVAAGKRLKLVNPYGDIHVRFGGYENKVEIVATISAWDGLAWRSVKSLEDETSLSLDVRSWAAGNPGFRVRLRHYSHADPRNYFSADNVRVTLTTGASCTTAP